MFLNDSESYCGGDHQAAKTYTAFTGWVVQVLILLFLWLCQFGLRWLKPSCRFPTWIVPTFLLDVLFFLHTLNYNLKIIWTTRHLFIQLLVGPFD